MKILASNITTGHNVIFLIVNALAIINLIVLSLFLALRKHNSLPNYILAAIIYLPVHNFTFNLFLLSGLAFEYPKSILIGTSLFNTTFPLLFYLYIRILSGKTIKKTTIYIPWLFIVVASIIFHWYFLSFPFSQQVLFIKQLVSGTPPVAFKSINIVFFLTTFFYSLLSIRLGIKHFNSIRAANNTTSIEYIRAHYTKTLSYITVLLSATIIVLYWIIPYQWVEFFVIPIAMTIVFFVIVFSAQKAAAIFSSEEFKQLMQNATSLSEKENLYLQLKNFKKRHPKIDVEKINTAINTAIKKQFYLDSNISLLSMSEQYDIPKNDLSAYINEVYGSSFSDFVNKFRVEYAIKLLQSNNQQHLSIEGIGKSAGFNSRASFYRAFKKFTLQSPKDFINNKQ